MGWDQAPFVAKNFLYYFENKWISNLKKSYQHKPRSFIDIVCFMDDLCAIDDNGLFENISKKSILEN